MTDKALLPWRQALVGLLVLATTVGTARAQASSTFSDGILIVSGDAVVDLEGGTLTFATTGTLSETDGGRITGGLLTTTQALDAPSGVDPAGLGVVITSGANLGVTTVTRGHTAQTGEGNEGILRYYDITPTDNAGLDATLVIEYHDAELNGLTEATLVLFRSTDGGTMWTQEGGTVDTDANTLTLSGIDALSRWTAGSTATPLPVELTAFEAVVDGAAVLLTWATASETNNAGFEVQRQSGDPACSGPGCAWRTIAFVTGAGTSVEARQYAHRVIDVAPGSLRFRLKQVDFDGAFAYSPEVEVDVVLPQAYVLSAVYPNPFNPEGRFTLAVRETQHVRVDVYDALGRRVARLHDGLLEANRLHAFVVAGRSLASGLYVVRATGERFTAATTASLLK